MVNPHHRPIDGHTHILGEREVVGEGESVNERARETTFSLFFGLRGRQNENFL